MATEQGATAEILYRERGGFYCPFKSKREHIAAWVAVVLWLLITWESNNHGRHLTVAAPPPPNALPKINTINTRMAHETWVSEAVLAPRCQAQTQGQKKRKKIHHHRLTCSSSVYPHLRLGAFPLPVDGGAGGDSVGTLRFRLSVDWPAQSALCSPTTSGACVPRRATVSHRRSSITQAAALLVRYLKLCPSARWLMVFIFRLAVTSDSSSSRRP